MTPERRDAYLSECRQLVIDEVSKRLGDDATSGLGRAMLEYPLREGKGLRPALCIAACRALGGSLEGVIPSASVLELFHNAFLIHDDVEDGSELRRSKPTLHSEIGIAAAINAGDAMFAWALEPLLDNMEVLDLGRALQILEVIARLARETVRGQALELEWIRTNRWDITPDEYRQMVVQKTAWYTFVAPLLIGGIAADAGAAWRDRVEPFGESLGVAFQIRDDVLNLTRAPAAIGKEACGDLWEGKRTLILSHFFAHASEPDRARAQAILVKARPSVRSDQLPPWVGAALDRLIRASDAPHPGLRDALSRALEASWNDAFKSAPEVEELRELLDRYGCVESAETAAAQWADRARRSWSAIAEELPRSVHTDLIESLVAYVASRGR